MTEAATHPIGQRAHDEVWARLATERAMTTGEHIAGITTRPEEYERRVIEFFDRTLLPSSPAGRRVP